MGSVNNGIKLAAFQNSVYPSGLDLDRSVITNALGTWKAASAALFRAGAPVMLNSNGEVVLSDGTQILGVAKWPKMTLGVSLVVDQAVTFGVASATKNLKPNLVGASATVNSVQVRSQAGMSGGTLYAVTTDYTLNMVNGTITQVSGGTIVPTSPVYVTYTWQLVESDYQFEGKNFWNNLDYWTVQDGHGAVVEAPSKIFTSEYDTAQAYTLTGATSNVYVNSAGLFTSVSSGNKLVGHVISVPAAGDIYLGINFTGQVVANS